MKKQMSTDSQSGMCMCGGKGCPMCMGGGCGSGCCKGKIWLVAIAGLVLLIGGLGILPFSGFSTASWFNFWTVAGAFLLVKGVWKMMKMQG